MASSSADAKPPAEEKQTPTAAAETKDKAAVALGEDDEFEDFPVDDWQDDQTEAAAGSSATKHLWEESWDDDDTTDDFSTQLKEELKKVEAAKRR
ncbi:DSS1/SEM1 family-domain-containing protein [Stachybotrys elegans]|uniref:26S proteasome complex subunit SEM1 n=1 Tax=Stachybotrys elegans TaxID=80388 RepID=A0A8K0SNH4_9HYPO|nr:DSS1/SEM1 family-domain-containing protein [Stachybotrys elegans]